MRVTWEDVEQLMARNPLAAEQLKNIVLRRMLTEAEEMGEGLHAVEPLGATEPASPDDA
jgi:hypothetical protein